MKPVRFECRISLPISSEEIAQQILDAENWTDFQGYGPLPGIKTAKFEVRTPEIVGSQIAVENSDGSRHIEEITEWQPDKRIALQMHSFTPPLSRLAKSIDELWEFQPSENETKVTRSFQIHPRSHLTRPILWLISHLLKKAIIRHFQQILTRSK